MVLWFQAQPLGRGCALVSPPDGFSNTYDAILHPRPEDSQVQGKVQDLMAQ